VSAHRGLNAPEARGALQFAVSFKVSDSFFGGWGVGGVYTKEHG
jgi:hypothetical protein